MNPFELLGEIGKHIAEIEKEIDDAESEMESLEKRLTRLWKKITKRKKAIEEQEYEDFIDSPPGFDIPNIGDIGIEVDRICVEIMESEFYPKRDRKRALEDKVNKLKNLRAQLKEQYQRLMKELMDSWLEHHPQ